MSSAEKTPEEKIVDALERLDRNYWTAADRLTSMSKYFEFLADRTDYNRMHVDAAPSTVRRYDSVVLQFRDELHGHQNSVREESERLLNDDMVSRVLGAFANLTPDDLDSIRIAHRRKAYPTVVRALLAAGNPFIATSANQIEDFGLTPNTVLAVKMRLGRLAELARYAASLEHEPNEPNFEQFRSYYDPSRLDPERILQYLAEARSHVASVPDESLRRRLDTALAEVESEVRRPRPRWGKIAATLLFLLSVAANVKEVAPGVYDKAAQVLQDLVTYIVQGGQVSQRPEPMPKALPSAYVVQVRKSSDDDEN